MILTNHIAYMENLKELHIKEADMPTLTQHDVLVKVEYVGICGSDVHLFERGKIGDFIVEPPFVLGHEVSGTVEAVGESVQGLQKGDRVALEPGINCGQCKYCKHGKYNLCVDMQYLAAPPTDGALQRYMAYPENLCFKLPESVSLEEGALIEPFSVGLHAAKRGNVEMGKTVVILGAGSIGLVTLLASKALGASNIIITDVIEKRLSFAKKLGAKMVVNSKHEDVESIVNKVTKGEGADIVIETAGAEITIQQSAHLVAPGGTIVAVGLPPQEKVTFDFVTMINKEVDMKTVFRFRNKFDLAIDAIESGRVPLKEIITHEFNFFESQKAFDYVVENKEKVVKALIKY